MKKFLLSLIGMTLMTSITFAQQSRETDFPCTNLYDKTYFHLSIGVNPMTFTTSFIGDDLGDKSSSFDMTGISWGLTTGVRMMKTQPFYLEVGVKFMYAFNNEKEYNSDNTKSYKINESLFSANIPIAVTWQAEVTPEVCIAPYVGLNMRFNIFGQTRTEDYDIDYEDTFNWFQNNEGNCNPFNIGLTCGANLTFNRFILGLGYTKDFTEFMLDTKIDYFTISAGCRF